MTEQERREKRREYLRNYAREWRKNNPEKEAEYRERVWKKKLGAEHEGKEETK